jgi:hypothetical protein
MNEVKNVKELKDVLDSLVNEYIDETEHLAGPNLDWDGDGTNVGISKDKLIKDFIDYLTFFNKN